MSNSACSANLIEQMNLDGKKPLPRFLVLPARQKAVVVLSGDDHANGGAAGRLDTYTWNIRQGARSRIRKCVQYLVITSTPTSHHTGQGPVVHDPRLEVARMSLPIIYKLHVSNAEQFLRFGYKRDHSTFPRLARTGSLTARTARGGATGLRSPKWNSTTVPVSTQLYLLAAGVGARPSGPVHWLRHADALRHTTAR